MKFGILKERKSPPDRRVVFSPDAIVALKQSFPNAEIVVESSDLRVFSDQEYIDKGITVSDNLESCDVLLGVKEVPVSALIPNKKYFFFSHTIKKQPHNQKLLRAILDNNIELYDHETIVDQNNNRLIGFGKYAGVVGCYNAFRAFGIKFELFELPKAATLRSMEELVQRLRRVVLPPIKIVVTGNGKVGKGIKLLLDEVKIKQVAPDDFLAKKYSDAVYTQIDVIDYNRRADGKIVDKNDFYANPTQYVSDFERFSEVSDVFMAGHFYGNDAPAILTREMLRSPKNKIKVVADISCDVAGPIASTLRSSTIAEPFYGYHPEQDKEIDMFHPAAIVVMAVDNLPCELPKDASDGFGEMFLKNVIPAFFNEDQHGILQRARITAHGALTPRFAYLDEYASGVTA